MKIFIGCSANNEIPSIYKKECEEYLTYLLKENDLLFGACNDGIMGIAYNIALSNKRKITGISPDFYKDNLQRIQCDKVIITKTVAERTDALIKESDILIFLPGGIGTLYELLTCIESKRGSEFDKPIIIYNCNNYYDKFFEFIDIMQKEGFATKEVLSNFHVSDSLNDTISYIKRRKK